MFFFAVEDFGLPQDDDVVPVGRAEGRLEIKIGVLCN
jgi:hypothetical protein